MSQRKAKKSSISAREMRAIARRLRSSESWRNVKHFVETVMPCKAGCVMVDLDSVILFHNSEDSRLGRVLPLGRKLIKLLRKTHSVYVLTARAKQHQEILTYLHRNNVWVDRVSNRKVYADAYFDDKAFNIPKNWTDHSFQQLEITWRIPRHSSTT